MNIKCIYRLDIIKYIEIYNNKYISIIINTSIKMPQLRLILGPMFAGKSSSLIDIANKLIEQGINKEHILLINHGSDKRYNSNSKICTHDGKTMESIALTNMMDIFNNEKIDISKIKCIFY